MCWGRRSLNRKPNEWCDKGSLVRLKLKQINNYVSNRTTSGKAVSFEALWLHITAMSELVWPEVLPLHLMELHQFDLRLALEEFHYPTKLTFWLWYLVLFATSSGRFQTTRANFKVSFTVGNRPTSHFQQRETEVAGLSFVSAITTSVWPDYHFLGAIESRSEVVFPPFYFTCPEGAALQVHPR